MHRTTPDAEDPRRAYIRVGAAAVVVFLVLLLIGATRGPELTLTEAMHHVAGAALPVAIGLLVLAAIGRGILWAQAGDERLRVTANLYFEPLVVVGGIAAVLDVVALALAGDASPLSFLPPLALAAGAGAVVWDRLESASAEGEEPERREPAPEPEPEPAAAPNASLWAGPAEEPAPRTTLWSGQ